MKQIDIKKGDAFICIKTVKMKEDKRVEYKKGYLYKSERDNCITNESNNNSHYWEDLKEIRKYFLKIKY